MATIRTRVGKSPTEGKPKYELPVNVQDILLASLLGDGSLKIPKGRQLARFELHHGKAQEDYFHWKVGLLTPI